MNMVKVFICICICVFSVSCIDKYVGKSWPEDYYRLRINSKLKGGHKVDYESLTLKYKYWVNPQRSKITLDGAIHYREAVKYDGVFDVSFEATFFFLDKNNVVLKMEHEELYMATMESDSFPVQLTFPYNEKYDSISCIIEYYVIY